MTAAALRRSAAAAWFATVVLSVVGTILAAATDLGVRGFLDSFLLGALTTALAFGSVGALIARRRPRNPVGWLFLAQGVLNGVLLVNNPYALLGLAGSGHAGWVASWIWIPAFALLALALLVFPDGTFLSRRWRLFAAFIVALTFTGTVAAALRPVPTISGLAYRNPVAVPGMVDLLTALFEFAQSALGLGLLVGVSALLVRLRRADASEKAQLKLIVVATAISVAIYVATAWVGYAWIGYALAWPVFAVASGVAILRHGLLDLDVVVSRTLVATLLAAFVTVGYVAVAIGIGGAVGARGDIRLSLLATALVATAFAPVHLRVRRSVDRFVLGARADPLDALTRASQHLGHSATPTAELLGRVARSVADGTGAAQVLFWRRTGELLAVVAGWPQPDGVTRTRVVAGPTLLSELPDQDLAVDVRHAGELLGAISLRKRPGEQLTAGDRTLLVSIANQAGLVLRNAELNEELLAYMQDLRRSRQRLVSAQDRERRRLERNLHDGAQQQLLGLKAKIGAARVLLDAGESQRTRAVLEGLSHETDRAIAALRELAQGIHPPLLVERGLGAALSDQARRSPLQVHVHASGVGRHPPVVETAVYFCCLEAMANAAKHAGGLSCRIRLEEGRTALRFRVTDDGRGFDADQVEAGTGLASMRDRIEACGGTLRIHSSGDGTTVEGEVPLAQDHSS